MDARRRLTIAVAAVVAVALVGGGALAFVRAFRESPTLRDVTIVPAERTEEPTRSVVPTYAAPATPTAGTPVIGTPERAPLIAYRRDGRLCVAGEDGSGERVVAESASGPFALSPDGRTLAFVDGESGRLSVADVATGEVRPLGAARPDVPSWSSDSAWFVYTAADSRIHRVDRDGTGEMVLFSGRLPAVGPGGVVIGATGADEGPGIRVWRDGRVALIDTDSTVTALACGPGRAYLGLSATGETEATIVGIPLGSARPEVIVDAPEAVRPVVFADLSVSPSATHLAYTEHGDDGYSRVFVVQLDTRARTGLSMRRDTTPLGWGSAGEALLILEGNPIQGETMALVRVGTDGMARRYLMERVFRW